MQDEDVPSGVSTSGPDLWPSKIYEVEIISCRKGDALYVCHCLFQQAGLFACVCQDRLWEDAELFK